MTLCRGQFSRSYPAARQTDQIEKGIVALGRGGEGGDCGPGHGPIRRLSLAQEGEALLEHFGVLRCFEAHRFDEIRIFPFEKLML